MKKYIGLEEMSNVNCASVLSVIRECGEVSRKRISDITGLSWGGMTKIVNKLFEHEYIVEDKSEAWTGQGRTPHVIRINKNKHVVIGLDINRVGFSAYVMNLAGDVLQKYYAEERFDNKEELLHAILTFTRTIVEEYKEKKILSIGVAMQGLLDVEKGISIKFPHCSDWKHVPIKQILEQEFETEVFVEHDPNCMLYACMHEEENENMLLLRMDSSIGMAASINGSIIRGNGLLEIAHCTVIPDGKPCRCGQKGCLEAYIAPCLSNKKLQKQAVQEMVHPLAIVMNNMYRIFHVDKIILTGRLVSYREGFEKELLDAFYQRCEEREVSVTLMEETNQAVYGAALIAAQGAIEQLKL